LLFTRDAVGLSGPRAWWPRQDLLSLVSVVPAENVLLYRKLGDLDRAREHLHRAQAGISALGDDEYGQLIKAGLDRLAQQLTPR
jgi:hypothetical protein